MGNQLDKEIQRVQDSWNALERVLGNLTDGQWVELTDGRWSVKDHLAHIALAEQYARAALRGEPPHELFGIEPETLLKLSDDELNAALHPRIDALTTDEVKALVGQSHQELLDTMANVSEEILEQPYAPYGEPLGLTMLDILSGNTYVHYDLHREWIEAIVSEQT